MSIEWPSLPFSQFTGKQFVSKIDAIEAQPCVKTLLYLLFVLTHIGVTM